MFKVLSGDCREVMAELEAESVDAIVTDPPYELGFMGKSWDSSGVAFDPETWRHALRVLKPGGHLLAFSGSRTYHRMACAIEDAGFEIRDQIMWVYGSGFPKSHDVSKAIDREAGAEREVVGRKEDWWPAGRREHSGPFMRSSYRPFHDDPEACERSRAITAPATDAARTWSGWGTALKPAHEPIVVARKPFKGTVAANVMAHGTGALNIDGCRVGSAGGTTRGEGGGWLSSQGAFTTGHDVVSLDSGRWPANFIHDGSDEVLRLFPDVNGIVGASRQGGDKSIFNGGGHQQVAKQKIVGGSKDSGSAARFFYCPKASKRDREDGLAGFTLQAPSGLQGRNDGSLGSIVTRANHHPTVKPTELMRYLCRLVTPPGGLVLDPFTGSGSTGRGAVLEGFRFLGIEMDPGYMHLAIARIESAERSSPHGAT